MSSRTRAILIAFGLAAAAFFALPVLAQITPTNLWSPNYASSTITPRPSTLQIPCANVVGGCGSGATTSTINGVAGPTFTLSIVSTSSNSSITTSTAQLFLNLLQYTSSSDITISSTGTIVFANHNNSQFTNNSGYITTSTNNFGGITNASVTALSPVVWSATSTISCPTCSTVSTSSPNTWSQPQTFNGISNTGNVTSTSYTATSTLVPTTITNFNTTLNASTNEQGLDHGTYVDTLCQAALTNASSALINFPQEIISTSTGYQWTVPIIDSYNGGVCTYTGQGPQGTQWYWNGSTTTPATSENGGDANTQWGYGMNNLSLFGSYATSSTGLLIGGSNPSGGGQGVSNNNLVIKYFNVDESIATNTYLMMQTGGYIGAANASALVYNSVSNAGEGLLFNHVTFADTVQVSSTVQNCIAINGGFSSIQFTNSHFDDCGQTIASGASFGTEINTGDYYENTAGDTIGSYTPIVNNSTGVTVENYGGQFTQDASNSVPAAFIQNSGLFINYGITAFKNGTGTMARFVADSGLGQDQLYGWSNPNGAVTSYKSTSADGGLTTFLSESGNNLFPFQLKINSSTGAVSIYAAGAANVISSVASSGWLFAAQTLAGVPTVEIRAGSGTSSTLQMADATHYGCIAWGTPSGFVYQYATTTSPFIISTTTQPAWCNQ